MGGYGSGRRWHSTAKDTTESYLSIDVRWLIHQTAPWYRSRASESHSGKSRQLDAGVQIEYDVAPGCLIA